MLISQALCRINRLHLRPPGYGDMFVAKSIAFCQRTGIPDPEWLLAIISWETGHFKATGPPWIDVNGHDAGGGIVGFTRSGSLGWNTMTAAQQLDLAENMMFVPQKRAYQIDKFRSPVEAYWIVTGPGGLVMGPEDTRQLGTDNDGKPRSRGWIRDTIYKFFTNPPQVQRIRWDPRVPVNWNWPTVGIEGQWFVRIGDWLGTFVFNQEGDVWYATVPPAATSGYPREIDMSDRVYGHWTIWPGSIKWMFGTARRERYPVGDIRTFVIPGSFDSKKVVGKIYPEGQGVFKMWRGGPEPD